MCVCACAQVNTPYVVWVTAIALTLLFMCTALCVAMPRVVDAPLPAAMIAMHHAGLPGFLAVSVVRRRLFRFGRHALVCVSVHVQANVMTGAVNLTMNTEEVGTIPAALLLAVYFKANVELCRVLARRRLPPAKPALA